MKPSISVILLFIFLMLCLAGAYLLSNTMGDAINAKNKSGKNLKTETVQPATPQQEQH